MRHSGQASAGKVNVNPLLAAYYSSKGYQVKRRLDLVGLSLIVFKRNYHELKQLLDDATSEEGSRRLFRTGNRQELNIILNELVRLLHNYLASVKTLADTVRPMMRETYEKTEFWEEYEAEKKRHFVDQPLHGFIEELRNYTLHFRLPIAIPQHWHTVNVNTRERESGVSFALDTQELRKHEKWTTKGMRYLKGAGDSIDLTAMVDKHYSIVDEFYLWLERRLREIHSDELSETEKLRKQIDDTPSVFY